MKSSRAAPDPLRIRTQDRREGYERDSSETIMWRSPAAPRSSIAQNSECHALVTADLDGIGPFTGAEPGAVTKQCRGQDA